MTKEQADLSRLKAENKRLRMERDIFYATFAFCINLSLRFSLR